MALRAPPQVHTWALTPSKVLSWIQEPGWTTKDVCGLLQHMPARPVRKPVAFRECFLEDNDKEKPKTNKQKTITEKLT